MFFKPVVNGIVCHIPCNDKHTEYTLGRYLLIDILDLLLVL